MKCLQKYLAKIFGLLVTFFPLLAFADDTYKWNLTSIFAPKSTDLSVAFLSQIFGGAGGGLAAGGASIMGEIFGVFNSGLLTITGLVLVYVTLRSITDTAMDGEAMGKKMNHWMAIRVAAGIGLLVPKASGYSVLNSIVIWMTMQGIGFADTVWDHALDYLGQGGVIYRNVTSNVTGDKASGVLDQTLAIGDKMVLPVMSASSTNFGASDIFRSLVCMYTIQEGIRNNQKLAIKDVEEDVPLGQGNGRKYYPNDPGKYRELLNYLHLGIALNPAYKHEYDQKSTTAFAQASFPGDDLKIPGKDSYYYLGSKSGDLPYLRSCCTNPGDAHKEHDCSSCFTKTNNPNGICGRYTVAWVEGNNAIPGAGITQTDYNTYIAAKFAALQQTVADLSRAAEEYVTRKTDDRVTDDKSRKCIDSGQDCFAQTYTDSVANDVLNATGEYQAIIEPARIMCTRVATSTATDKSHCYTNAEDLKLSNRNFIYDANSDAKKIGWIGAGRYYLDIAKLTEVQIAWDKVRYQILVLDALKPPFSDSVTSTLTSNTDYDRVKNYMKEQMAFADDDIKDFKARLTWVIRAETAKTDTNLIAVEPQTVSFITNINKTLQASTKEMTSPFAQRTDISHLKEFPAMNLIFDYLQRALDSIYANWKEDLFDNPVSGSATFPLLRIHNFGVGIMQNVASCLDGIFTKLRDMLMGFYAKEMTANAAGMLAGGMVAYYQPFGEGGGYVVDAIINHALNMINATLQVFLEIPVMIALPMALSVLMPLFVTGVSLAYYVPLIPFMLFTFGTISWLMFVIEAMAAAPLIALGITHPEGHDLLGKAEQGLMLLFSVFLRPVCMVIGLIASLILSYVALNVLNSSFNYVVINIGQTDFGGASTSTVKSYFNVLTFVVLLMIYLLIVIALMNQCFSLIHLIPEKVMRWLGMHPEAGPEAQMMESVKAGVTPFAEAGRGVTEGTGRLASGTGQLLPTKWAGIGLSGHKPKDPKDTGLGGVPPPP